ncbi:glutamine-hydrolyzing carbamoyl-phosphate synthase small subunit [Anaerovorax odorimutans]|uniref:Carbamoyl phosphate synthase small chain n=2 Tax=Anaerovorax odorimutans TaxID=109327 RepID=A0ABT1RQ15_9FIRM|nr:glutamine-hydrolyzing carbamoyl-phosphate synthase small subunit [Anaerovorax odorimutans]MCQ4637288.1 glutamine-hydrolyzing carbamoyl-phosphate synthase small subunit [Anaerovorax odorimutans]
MEGLLYLEDGSVYKGHGFGFKGTAVGELVFNTSMTGYQKILTDPSYKGQVITMTYPLVGNYGISDIDNESGSIHAFGLVIKDLCQKPSNSNSVKSLDEWLVEQRTPGIWGVDTRKITKKIRTEGTVKCVISNEGISIEEAKKICETNSLRGDWMKAVSAPERMTLGDGGEYKVAVLDFGVKLSILKSLMKRGCELEMFPYGTPAEEILAYHPDGIFLTNGPGDPQEATEAVKETAVLLRDAGVPIFGICMGHQILALAAGGQTYKLKYGHRGGNHGVYDKDTKRSYITSQNHGYAVKMESIMLNGMEVTHLNLNDGTVEGMEHRDLPVFSVQFHPEASPGPNDSAYLFDKFVTLMKGGKDNA